MEENIINKNFHIIEVGAAISDMILAAKGMSPVLSAIALTYKNTISVSTKREKYWIPKMINICKEFKARGYWIAPEKEEEFVSYLLVLNQNVIKTHQEQKIELFENLLKGYILHNEVDYDTNILFLNLTDRLTLKHIKILESINNCDENRLIGLLSLHELFLLLLPNNSYMTFNQFNFLLKELNAFGLIEKSENIKEESKVSRVVGNFVVEHQPYEKSPLLKLTEFAYDYMSFLYR